MKHPRVRIRVKKNPKGAPKGELTTNKDSKDTSQRVRQAKYTQRETYVGNHKDRNTLKATQSQNKSRKKI